MDAFLASYEELELLTERYIEHEAGNELRELFDAAVVHIEVLGAELRHQAARGATGAARPDLQRVAMLAVRAIRAGWAELRLQLAADDYAAVGAALNGDVRALVPVLQGRLRIVAPGEEPN